MPKKPEITKENSEDEVITPKKIVVFSPVVLDFIRTYGVKVTILDISKFLTDGKLSFNKEVEISKFKPDYIFLDKANEKLSNQLKNAGKIVYIDINKDNYFHSVKNAYIQLSNLLGSKKEVLFDIISIEESVKLIIEKLPQEKQKKFLEGLNKIKPPEPFGSLRIYKLRLNEFIEKEDKR